MTAHRFIISALWNFARLPLPAIKVKREVQAAFSSPCSHLYSRGRYYAKGNVRSGLQVSGNGFGEVLYLDSLGNGLGEGLEAERASRDYGLRIVGQEVTD